MTGVAASVTGVAASVTGVVAAVVALGACGDNVTPRLAPTRYVYDDGTEQIDRHQLFDQQLGTLCTPTEFSDGHKYCEPPTDEASYLDESCTRIVGRVPSGLSPPGYFATRYFGSGAGSDLRPSRVYRSGSPTTRPAARWEKFSFGCFASPVDLDYDYYEVDEEVELASVTLEPWFRSGAFLVDTWNGDHIKVPARIDGCDDKTRANSDTTICMPEKSPLAPLFADAACSERVITGVWDAPPFNYDPISDCTTFFESGEPRSVAMFYERAGSSCVESNFPVSPVILVHEAREIEGPRLQRAARGVGRIQEIAFRDLPLDDDLVHDTELGTDCQRVDDGRCVPATNAKVETWFADPACGTPIDVAMVRTGGCNAPMPYAERDGQFFAVLNDYAGQLYQLSTGDTCQIYNPPAPLVAYSIGPALGADAFARATLMIE